MASVPVEGQPGQGQWPGACSVLMELGRKKRDRQADPEEPCGIQKAVLVGVRLPRCLEVGSSHPGHASFQGRLPLILSVSHLMFSSMRPGWSRVAESGGPSQISWGPGLQCTHNGYSLPCTSVSFRHSHNPGHSIRQILCPLRWSPPWDLVCWHL